MTRDRDVKKSNFSVVSATQATDKFDFVRAGQNLSILQSDLVNDFGVSGPLQTRGEITGQPVLKVISNVNYIRNLVAGSGIRLDSSPQDGIEINHNFDIDKTGVPVMINELTNAPTLRSFQAGTGISLAGSGDTIVVATSGSPGSTKTVQVFSSADLPDASLGVITLADDTEYLFQNDVTLSDRLIQGEGTVISGADALIITLTYSGVSVFITATDNDTKIKDIHLKALSGTLFAWTDTVGDKIFRLSRTSVSCLNFGNFNGSALIHISDLIVHDVTGTGITCSGAHGVFAVYTSVITKTTGVQNIIDLGSATFCNATIHMIVFQNDGTGYCISGAASSENINVAGIGTVTNVLQKGTGPVLQNITSHDDRWEMQLSPQIIDSSDLVLATHAGATIAIAAAATPVIVGAAWTTHLGYRFTGTAGGRWTYNGKGAIIKIDATISSSIVTGTDDVAFFFYKNGGQISASAVTREYIAGNIGNLSLLWDVELATDDYIEVWVQNNDTNVDIVISNATLRARS